MAIQTVPADDEHPADDCTSFSKRVQTPKNAFCAQLWWLQIDKLEKKDKMQAVIKVKISG